MASFLSCGVLTKLDGEMKQPTQDTEKVEDNVRTKSVIGQIWDDCLMAEGEHVLPEEVRTRFKELLKSGKPLTKENLEAALYHR